MPTWLIVVIVVVAIVVLLLIALAMSRRSRTARLRKEEQAREHLQEAQVRGAQAAKEQALADTGVQALLEVFPAEIRDIEEM